MGEGGKTTKKAINLFPFRFVLQGYCDLPSPFSSLGFDAVYLPNACWKAKMRAEVVWGEGLLIVDAIVIMFKA